jgi:outer membrane protein OmpA-like peptidoglycan-associated protein
MSAFSIGILARAPLTLVLGSMLLTDPACAEDSLKELLDKAQSQSETRAVEDLIRKLQGARAAPAAPTPSSAPATLPPAPPVVIEAQPAAKGAPAPSESVPQREPVTESASTTPTATPPPAVAPQSPEAATEATMAAAQRAVESADQNQLPSVDLEVNFELASTAITPQAAADLTPLGRALADPRLASDTFLIAGHSDAQGPANYNLRLSQKRAESVRQFLISKFGIRPERLVARGFGEERLKNPRQPFAAENRRVQVVNMAKQASR